MVEVAGNDSESVLLAQPGEEHEGGKRVGATGDTDKQLAEAAEKAFFERQYANLAEVWFERVHRESLSGEQPLPPIGRLRFFLRSFGPDEDECGLTRPDEPQFSASSVFYVLVTAGVLDDRCQVGLLVPQPVYFLLCLVAGIFKAGVADRALYRGARKVNPDKEANGKEQAGGTLTDARHGGVR